MGSEKQVKVATGQAIPRFCVITKRVVWDAFGWYKYRECQNFKSIVDETIKNEIIEANWCTDLIQYNTYKCKMDGLIAAAYLFCPQIIQVKDYIFVKAFAIEMHFSAL